MISKEVLDILVCPKCKGELRYDKDNNLLFCDKCKLRFNIINDVPDLLLEHAENI